MARPSGLSFPRAVSPPGTATSTPAAAATDTSTSWEEGSEAVRGTSGGTAWVRPAHTRITQQSGEKENDLNYFTNNLDDVFVIASETLVCNEWTELNCRGEAAPEELEEHTMVAHEVQTHYLTPLSVY